jgi:hypothetical protein
MTKKQQHDQKSAAATLALTLDKSWTVKSLKIAQK